MKQTDRRSTERYTAPMKLDHVTAPDRTAEPPHFGATAPTSKQGKTMTKKAKKTAKTSKGKCKALNLALLSKSAKLKAKANRSATGAKAVSLSKEKMHPEATARRAYTNALHTPEAKANMTTKKAMTAENLAKAIKDTVQDYDFKNDRTDRKSALQAVLDFMRDNKIELKTGTVLDIPGIASRNNKAGSLFALAYWGVWSARQFRNLGKENCTDSMQFTITSQSTTEPTGINHVKSEATKNKYRDYKLK